MKLRKPCEHDRYDEHVIWNGGAGKPVCAGGEFLPEDAIEQAFAIIGSLTDPRYVIFSEWQQGGAGYFDDADGLASDQVGEPE